MTLRSLSRSPFASLMALGFCVFAYSACTRGEHSPEDDGVSGSSGSSGGANPSVDGAAVGGSSGSAPAGGAAGQSGGTAGSGGGAGGSSGVGGAGGAGGKPTLPSGRGATLPFVEYEAEAMQTNGVVLPPTRAFTAQAAEASGRQAVRLSKVGDYVKFTNQSASNSIVVRYSIPDGGANYWATLGVYVNDALRTRLRVTSRYSWTYGGDATSTSPIRTIRACGTPHHFFDEARALIGDIPVGATVMLRKDAEDTAADYVIDLVDMEPVPGPLAKPQGFLSVTDDCGATPNDDSDDSRGPSALHRSSARRGPSRALPAAGRVSAARAGRSASSNITIRGAGMWHSTVTGFHARFDCWGNNCKYYDFSVFGDTTLAKRRRRRRRRSAATAARAPCSRTSGSSTPRPATGRAPTPMGS